MATKANETLAVNQKVLGTINTSGDFTDLNYFYQDSAGTRQDCGKSIAGEGVTKTQVELTSPTAPSSPIDLYLELQMDDDPSTTADPVLMGSFSSFAELKSRVNDHGCFLQVDANIVNDDYWVIKLNDTKFSCPG